MHGIQPDVEFVSQLLRQGGDDSLPHFNLTGVAGDLSVFANSEKGVEILRKRMAAATAAFLSQRAGHRAENEDATTHQLQKITPVEREKGPRVFGDV